ARGGGMSRVPGVEQVASVVWVHARPTLTPEVHGRRAYNMTMRPIVIPEGEIHERFVRSSGPGGQNVNKVATTVELRFDVRASSLPADVKDRLVAVAGSRMRNDGTLV